MNTVRMTFWGEVGKNVADNARRVAGGTKKSVAANARRVASSRPETHVLGNLVEDQEGVLQLQGGVSSSSTTARAVNTPTVIGQ